MSNMLPDGTVVPAFMGVGDTSGDTAGTFDMLTDTGLRLGEVTASYAPTNPKNASKKEWEYDVSALSFRNGGALQESYQPYRCKVAELFGSVADHLRYTVRPASRKPAGKEAFADGSLVLILCPNGDKGQALIVGAMRNQRDQKADPDKTFLDFVFNGVQASIDEKGSLTLKVPGATKLDGTPDDNRDKNNKGTSVSFGANGSIAISDANGDTVTVSPKDKSITVTAGEQTTTVEKKWKLKAATVEVVADSVTVDAGKVFLGGTETSINPLDEVVVGSGIDTFTGLPYKGLGSTSTKVKAGK
jgi:hypothetical protein